MPHWIVKPVELSREAQGHPRSIFAIARRVWVHTDIGVRIYICSNSAISVRIAGDSNHRSKRCKCSWKGYVNRTAGKINSGSPLDRKACGIITCCLKRIQLLANASQLFHLSCNKRYCYRLEKCQLAELLRLLNRLSVWRQSRLRTQKFLGNCYFRTNLCPIGS